MGEGPIPGFYWGDDGIYKVRISKAGHWYAMRAVPNPNGHRVGWHYVGQRVHLNEPMTAAEAGRFTCHCMVCGSRLDTPESRERGMGSDMRQESEHVTTLYPVSLHIEQHPSGAILDVVCDVNAVDPVRVSLTRDVALILRSQLDKALAR